MKVALSSRGIYEPVISEENVLGQIRQLLEINGALVYRARKKLKAAGI